MSTYHIETDKGTYEVEVADAPQTQQPPASPPSFGDTVMASAKDVLTSPKRIVQGMTPQNLTEQAPVLGAVGGEMAAGPAGAAVGAGAGTILKRVTDPVYGRPSAPVEPGPVMGLNNLWSPKEAIAPMAQTAVAGLPGTTEGQAITKSIGKGLAKVGQSFSGARADILEQGAKQGYQTYLAPSMTKASDTFAEALGPEGQATMKQTASQAFDPALGQARQLATHIGSKIEAGETVSPLDALKARQATDRVISATPVWDAKARSALYDWRNTFDKIIQDQAGPLKDASTTYRQAIVKDALLKPLPVNKHGEYSRLAPMLAGLAGGVGGIGGHNKTGGALGTAGYLLATSPLAMGAAATTLGAISPEVRTAALAKFIDKITTKENSQ